jgi:hypothetical protein
VDGGSRHDGYRGAANQRLADPAPSQPKVERLVPGREQMDAFKASPCGFGRDGQRKRRCDAPTSMRRMSHDHGQPRREVRTNQRTGHERGGTGERAVPHEGQERDRQAIAGKRCDERVGPVRQRERRVEVAEGRVLQFRDRARVLRVIGKLFDPEFGPCMRQTECHDG